VIIHIFLLILIFFFNFLFIVINHPLSIGLILISQTLLVSLLTGSLRFNFWFSYSLFLIFIGGILILFIYMTSLASNEIFKFQFNKKIITLIITITIILLLTILFYNFTNLNLIKTIEDKSIIEIKNLIIRNLNNLVLQKIFNFPTNLLSILLINYLFLTLIARVKITNIFKGPLRPSIK